MVADVLSRLIQREVDNGWLQGYKIKRQCLAISHILFADDTLVFSKASIIAAGRLLSILYGYSVASGQRINFHKS